MGVAKVHKNIVERLFFKCKAEATETVVRAELNQELFFLLDENGYPPEWNDEVFDQVLDQVENYKQHSNVRPRLRKLFLSSPSLFRISRAC